MGQSHRELVGQLLEAATAQHTELLSRVPAELRESLPVDAQGR